MVLAGVLDQLDMRALADEVRRTGVAHVPSVLSGSELDEARQLARRSVDQAGGYAFRAGPDLAGTVIDDLGRSAAVRELLSGLYEEAVGSGTDQDVHPVLRCLTGESGAHHALRFHFDSYVVTAVLPIEIPTDRPGDLLYYPNQRPVRRSGAVNVAEKAVVQNGLARRLMTSRSGRFLAPPRRLTLTPGDLYLFWGYRTFHANDLSDPSELRATALFHFGDPHLHDPVVRFLRRVRS